MSDFQIPFNPAQLPLGNNSPRIDRLVKSAGGEDEDMAQAAKDFESILIHQLMQEMSRTIDDSGLLSSGPSKQMQGIFWSFLAEEVADSGGLGLWKDIQQYCTGSPQDGPPAPTLEQEL